MTNEVDTHSPADAVAWLRKRAEENRRVAELPPQDWPRDPGVLKHLAFRFDQTADLIDRLDKKCEPRLRAMNRPEQALQELADQAQRLNMGYGSPWIDIRERRPPDDWDCLVYGTEDGFPRMAVYRPLKPSQEGYEDERYSVAGSDGDAPTIDVTHWMPLPPAPPENREGSQK